MRVGCFALIWMEARCQSDEFVLVILHCQRLTLGVCLLVAKARTS